MPLKQNSKNCSDSIKKGVKNHRFTEMSLNKPFPSIRNGNDAAAFKDSFRKLQNIHETNKKCQQFSEAQYQNVDFAKDATGVNGKGRNIYRSTPNLLSATNIKINEDQQCIKPDLDNIFKKKHVHAKCEKQNVKSPDNCSTWNLKCDIDKCILKDEVINDRIEKKCITGERGKRKFSFIHDIDKAHCDHEGYHSSNPMNRKSANCNHLAITHDDQGCNCIACDSYNISDDGNDADDEYDMNSFSEWGDTKDESKIKGNTIEKEVRGASLKRCHQPSLNEDQEVNGNTSDEENDPKSEYHPTYSKPVSVDTKEKRRLLGRIRHPEAPRNESGGHDCSICNTAYEIHISDDDEETVEGTQKFVISCKKCARRYSYIYDGEFILCGDEGSAAKEIPNEDCDRHDFSKASSGYNSASQGLHSDGERNTNVHLSANSESLQISMCAIPEITVETASLNKKKIFVTKWARTQVYLEVTNTGSITVTDVYRMGLSSTIKECKGGQ